MVLTGEARREGFWWEMPLGIPPRLTIENALIINSSILLVSFFKKIFFGSGGL